MRFGDSLATPEAGVVLPGLVFPRAGLYAWHVGCGDEVVDERRIPVRPAG